MLAPLAHAGLEANGSPVFAQAEPQRVEAQSAPSPQPPCGDQPNPPYPGPNDPIIVKSWSPSDVGGGWSPPACLGWDATGFTTLVTTVAKIRFPAETEGWLRRFGAISEWKGLRYWSVTHKQWKTLIVDAYAVSSQAGGQRRADFSAEEMKEGNVLYFEQDDNLTGKAVYRIQIVQASSKRLVIKVENVGTIRYFLVPILHSGDLQSVYFLDRESEGVWRYYSIVRIGKNVNRLVGGNEASAINRAVAFYRHLAGIPSDTEPPAAR